MAIPTQPRSSDGKETLLRRIAESLYEGALSGGGGALEVTNAQKLGLTGISIGQIVHVTDGFVVTGTGAAGTYLPFDTAGGKVRWLKAGTIYGSAAFIICTWNDEGDFPLWEFRDQDNTQIAQSFEDVATPILVQHWAASVGTRVLVSGAITTPNANGTYVAIDNYLSRQAFRSVDHPDYWMFWDDDGYSIQFNNTGVFDPVGGQVYFDDNANNTVGDFFPWAQAPPRSWLIVPGGGHETITITAVTPFILTYPAVQTLVALPPSDEANWV